MLIVKRSLAGVVAIAGMLYLIDIFIQQSLRGGDLLLPFFGGVYAAVTALTAVSGWFALRGEDPRVRTQVRQALSWGRKLAGAGFLAGIVAPLLLDRESLGPLVGILVAAPLGFALGMTGGALWRKTEPNESLPGADVGAEPRRW